VKQLRSENLEITGHTTIAGTVEERIHVPSGAVLDLVGVALDGVVVTGGGSVCISGETRPLTVTVGGRAVLIGTCHGLIINDGGDVTIHGVVEGPIIEYAGRTVIAPEASTRGGGPHRP
jgi:hypothetical protein